MKEKKYIVVIFGGNSLEYNVSLKTGYSISKELYDSNEYGIFFIGILKNGKWLYDYNINNIILNSDNIINIKINEECEEIIQIGNGKINNIHIDCAFLATHGNNVEDGNLQGFLNFNNIKYTGNNIDGSVLCFNKLYCKIIANNFKIPIVPYEFINKNYDNIDNKLSKLELNNDQYVVKINKGGSSFGIFFSNKEQLKENILKAFKFDENILIEKEILCRELSIGIISNKSKLLISDIGEYKKSNNNFDFNEKYIKNNNMVVPVKVEENIKYKIINY